MHTAMDIYTRLTPHTHTHTQKPRAVLARFDAGYTKIGTIWERLASYPLRFSFTKMIREKSCHVSSNERVKRIDNN